MKVKEREPRCYRGTMANWSASAIWVIIGGRWSLVLAPYLTSGSSSDFLQAGGSRGVFLFA